ncbi:unnamed protein product [Amoebophrya sp. A25]|nr:unnamed protein product [Amoebophrya sp. A25]|eukprot:GSA25T00012856001.1
MAADDGGGGEPPNEVALVEEAGSGGASSSTAKAAVVQDAPALALNWIFGFCKDVISGVHHLGGSEIFYPAAHTGVIYDTATGQQKLLQGHVNQITASYLSQDKRWIVTADTGKESMLTVWDRHTGTPVKIMFSPYRNGVQALDMTPDSKYLATLSAPEMDGAELKQYLSVWDWTSENSDAPICTALIGTQDVQTCVVFNRWNISEIATNGRRRVFFWTWDEDKMAGGKFQFYSPALAAKDFKQKVGDFTQTLFLPNSTQAATGTMDGDVVIWDHSLIVDELSRPDERRAVKILRLCPDVCLNALKIHGNYVVVGSSDGAVRFYDYQFRLQAWFEDLCAGSVTSVSFDSGEEQSADGNGGSGQQGSEQSAASSDFQFSCPNFIVATASALVVACRSDLFFELEPQQRRGRLILQGLDSPVHGVCCHPTEPLLAVAGLSGFIHLWNFHSKTLQTVKIFEKILPNILEYSKSGLLAVGFTNGQIRILNSELAEVAQFRESRDPVTHLAFSENSDFLAVAHSDRSVCLFRHDVGATRGDAKSQKTWIAAGKQRWHHAPVVGLCFSQRVSPLRLYSLGEDRKLVEYECAFASDYPEDEQVGFPPLSSTVVDQEALPTGLSFLDCGLVISTSEFKFKTYRNRMCRRTSLAPTYGGPVRKMVPAKGEDDSFLLYATGNKVIGLLQQPLDGNPYRQMGVIAHPGQVSAITVDPQGKFAFSAGGEDLTINMWAIDTEPVTTAALRGGSGIAPYLKLIDDDFLAEIRDYFYYCQIRSHGERTTQKYVLDGTIPLSEVPYLMCALGCFPTQTEIANMIQEVKGSNFEQTGKYEEKLNFESFVKLYVNHRPVFQVDTEILENAVLVLAEGSKRNLLEKLVTGGEAFSDEELENCLKALTGQATLSPETDHVDGREFVSEVLGFADAEA